MRKLALSFVAFAFASTAAFAQTPVTFAQLDTDGDGRLSFAELQVAWPDLTQEEFNAVDAEGLGSLTPDQLNTLQPSTLPAPGAEVAPDAGGVVPDAGASDFTLDGGATDSFDAAPSEPVAAPEPAGSIYN